MMAKTEPKDRRQEDTLNPSIYIVLAVHRPPGDIENEVPITASLKPPILQIAP